MVGKTEEAIEDQGRRNDGNHQLIGK